MSKRTESAYSAAEKRVLLRLKVAPEDPDALQSLRDLNPYPTEVQVLRDLRDRDPEQTLSVILRRIAHQAYEYDPETQDPRKWIARRVRREIARINALEQRELFGDKVIDLLTGKIIAKTASTPASRRGRPVSRSRS